MSYKISLTQNKEALVDSVDYKYLNHHRWYAQKKKVKTVEDLWYVTRNIRRKDGSRTSLRMHRVIMENILREKGDLNLLKNFTKSPRKYPVDHINGNGLDNQRNNLRLVTHRQNMQNLTKQETTSKYPGVYWDKHRAKWAVKFRISPTKRKWIGRFNSEEKAFEAYREAVKKYCGEDVIPEIQ